MQNMYMTPLSYTNFSGVKKQTTLHFHITPRELTDWMVEHKALADELLEAFSDMQEEMAANPDGEATERQKLSMLRLVKILAEVSYGKPVDGGEVFDKSEAESFKFSAKYDAFRVFLFERPKELETFINTIMNNEVLAEFNARVNGGEAEAPAQLQPAGKNIPREELLRLMKEQGIKPEEL